jgi:hypothetical protein
LASKAIEQVREWLRKKRFPAQVSILDAPQPGVVLVFVPSLVVAQKKAGGKTSVRQMAHLRRMAHGDLAIDIEFRVGTDDGLHDIESGLIAVVREALSRQEVHAFVTSSLKGMTDVWIDAQVKERGPSRVPAARVTEVVRDYLSKVGLTLHQVYWQGSMVPSSVNLLRVVKVLEPVTVGRIAEYLQRKDYLGVPVRWVKAQLDRLRRDGLIAWRQNEYVITASGLSLLPSSRGPASSDIERALVLGRRRW